MAQVKNKGKLGFINELESKAKPKTTPKETFQWKCPVVKPEPRNGMQTISRMQSKASVEPSTHSFITEHRINRSNKK